MVYNVKFKNKGKWDLLKQDGEVSEFDTVDEAIFVLHNIGPVLETITEIKIVESE